MKKKTMWTVVGVVVVLGLLAGAFGCAQPAAPSAPVTKTVTTTATATQPSIAKQTWRFSTSIKPGTYMHAVFEKWWAELDKRTDGLITVEPHYTLSLYKGTEHLRVVRDGLLELACCDGGYIMGEMPVVGVGDLPFLIRDLDECREVRKAVGSIYAREHDKFDITTLSFWTGGPIWFFANDVAVTKLEDMKGLKVRVFSGLHGDAVEAMGAVPVFIPYTEVYTALQRGVVEAQCNTAFAFLPMKFSDFQRYANEFNLCFTFEDLIMPTALLKSLPPHLQEVVIGWAEWGEDLMWEETAKANLADIKKFEEQNVTVVEISPELKAQMAETCSPLWDKWAETAGPAGEEALDTAKRVLKMIRAE